MKKILSFVLVLALILGSVSMAFAASFTDVAADADYANAVTALVDLGVTTGKTATTFDPAGIVTRAEMAAFIIRALGLGDVSTAATQFADVPATYWASGYIAQAASLGIINGRTATEFDPTATVSYDEAIAMIVRALGYTEGCLNGTYPTCFVSKAKGLGILDNVTKTGTAGANRGDIVVLLYDSMDQEIGHVDKDGTFQSYYQMGGYVKHETMFTRLGAQAYTKPFVVTTEIAEDAVINIDEYVGAFVKALFNKDNEIIAISELLSTKVEGTFDKDGYFVTDDVTYKKFSYSDDPGYACWTYKKDGYDIGDHAYYSDNGDVEYDVWDFFYSEHEEIPNWGVKDKEFTVWAEVDGITVKNIYSIFQLDADVTVQYDADELADMIEDLEIDAYDIPEDKNGKVDYTGFVLVGADKLEDIKEDSVITVYANDKNEVTRLEVCDKVVEGEITKATATKYTINGTAYKVADGATGISDLAAGNTVKVNLTYGGKIFNVEKVEGTENYAVILNFKTTTGYSATYTYKLLLADGTTAEFDVDTDEFTAAKIANFNKSYEYEYDTVLPCACLVAYELNSDDEITSLKAYDNYTESDISAKGYAAGKKIESSVVAFVLSDEEEPTKAASYDFVAYKDLLDTEDVCFHYILNDDGKIVAMLIDEDSLDLANATYVLYAGGSYRTSVDGEKGWGVDLLVVGDKDAKAFVAKSQNVLSLNRASGAAFSTASGIQQIKYSGEKVNSINYLTSEKVTWGGLVVTGIDKVKIDDGAVYVTVTENGLLNSVNNQMVAEVDAAAGYDKYTFELADDYKVYVLNDDEDGFDLGKSTDITGIKDYDYATVLLFDLYDDDQVADVVVIYNDIRILR